MHRVLGAEPRSLPTAIAPFVLIAADFNASGTADLLTVDASTDGLSFSSHREGGQSASALPTLWDTENDAVEFAQAMSPILKATGAKKGFGDGQEITVQLDQWGSQVVIGVISSTPASGVLDCIALGKKVLADVQAVR